MRRSDLRVYVLEEGRGKCVLYEVEVCDEEGLGICFLELVEVRGSRVSFSWD